jgi:NADH-quinone oxidoreductase subunit C
MNGPYLVPTLAAGVHAERLSNEALLTRAGELLPAITGQIDRDTLVFHVAPEQLLATVTTLRDDELFACELLSDICGVHWPKGEHDIERQVSTTGWPDYRLSRDVGVIEVTYTLRSLSRNHLLRIVVATDDTDPRVPSVTGLFETANFHEREVYDFFGVDFTGHPGLARILMPDDWEGHPHRKDYPLGGVEVEYKNDLIIPSPHQRSLREVME